ncbi:MAG: efflux RND transporter periplasmic adaptor subunit, partial [Proteobacteria bacterium]|nr:efflux RND transporter periplasmic adaptor subunit [Pseudomonadota bacterium]
MDTDSEDTPRSKKPFIIMALLVVAGGWWWWSGKSDETKKGASAVNVTVAPVQKQDIPNRVPLVGTVIAYESVGVKARIDSQVVDVMFKDGDFVQEGQTLFVLDDRTVKAQIAQYTATLSKEQAQLANAQLQYSRAQQLRKTQVVAQAQVDEAHAAFEAQQALVSAAEANLENAQILLSYTQVKAPISGRTGTIGVTRGNNVKANDATPMVIINQISPIRVQTAIAQRYYEAVRDALARGEVEVTAQNKDSDTRISGKLEYVENSIDVASGTFSARAVFANEDEKLWPGMFVNVTVDLGMQMGALTVPAVAVQGDEGKHYIFTADPETKKAVRKSV